MAASLRARLGLALGATAVVSVAVTAVVSVGLLRRAAESDAREDLHRVARALALEPGEIGSADRIRLSALRRVLRVNGDELAVIRRNGAVLGTGAPLLEGVDVTPVLDGGEISGTVRSSLGDHVYVGVPVALPREPVGGVVLARPVGLTRDLIGPIVARVLLAAAVAAILAATLAAFLSRWLTRPLRSLSAAAARIARGDLSGRVPAEGSDELGALARSFNDMSEALAESQRREREFLASVSHELKTPLTSIRGYVEALEDNAVKGTAGRREALGIIRAETERLERMVQDVMDLARLGAREFRLDARAADLATTLQEAVTAHRAQAVEAGVGLEADLPDALPVETDPDRVRQVVSNLVENALRVTPAGGTIGVRARADAGGVRIEVSDTGPGIARDYLPHVFERSYLWRASRGERPVGTGLGLAIVRELVEVLGGRVQVASEIGRGTTFRVTLPSRAAQRA